MRKQYPRLRISLFCNGSVLLGQWCVMVEHTKLGWRRSEDGAPGLHDMGTICPASTEVHNFQMHLFPFVWRSVCATLFPRCLFVPVKWEEEWQPLIKESSLTCLTIETPAFNRQKCRVLSFTWQNMCKKSKFLEMETALSEYWLSFRED